MQVLYTASARATGDGRDGHVRTSDGTLDLDLAIPKEMGGAANPEQLVEAAHQLCPYSAATRGTIEVALTVGEAR